MGRVLEKSLKVLPRRSLGPRKKILEKLATKQLAKQPQLLVRIEEEKGGWVVLIRQYF